MPVTGMRSPFAATVNVSSLLDISRLCCVANHLLIIILVQPVSGVAEIWNAAPVCSCHSHRSSGGVLDAERAVLAYSEGGSLVSASCCCSLLGVARAKLLSFGSLLDLPPPLLTLVICPCLLNLELVMSLRLILHTFCL